MVYPISITPASTFKITLSIKFKRGVQISFKPDEQPLYVFFFFKKLDTCFQERKISPVKPLYMIWKMEKIQL